MGYGLGVDLGTTFTAAAVDRDGRVEMASLGDRAAAVPSVILIREDGSVLTGDAAERRAASDPDRVAREVKRRFGDPMPLILGGSPYAAGDLMAQQLRDVVRTVSEREGGMPEVVTLTHPANWGPYKREMFDQIPRQAGVRNVRMITEPEGAAAHYASNERLEEGATVAVYDLGGGTFDATVLRTTGDGFEILGTPEGIEGLGGIDFDEAVFAHVDRVLDGPVSALDPSDPRATSAVIRLRQDCALAKEALSADTETTIPVMLPSVQTEVRLTRGEFEDMIRPAIGSTIASLRRALESARVNPNELSTVLLVGGSSRIPLVSHMVSAELGRPTAVDAHPKHAIVLGAAGTSASTGVGGRAAAIGPRTGPWGMNAVTTATPAAGLDATRTAALHGQQAPGPRTTVASGPMSGQIPAQNPMPQPQPVGTPAPGMPAPSLVEQPAEGRKRRVPMAVAAALLLAVLAGGGTYAYRVASATTTPTAPATTGAAVEAPAPAPVPAPLPVVAPPVAPVQAPAPKVAPKTQAPAPAAPAPKYTPPKGNNHGGWSNGPTTHPKPDTGCCDGGDSSGGDSSSGGGDSGGGGDSPSSKSSGSGE